MSIPYLLIILVAIFGLYITYRIWKEKKKEGPMVCPLGADCHKVMGSEFSTFFGINLEFLGALYYLIIILGYILFSVADTALPQIGLFALFVMSAGGFLFSIYLTFVQAFYIKSWCSWCISSAIASTTIFLIAFYAFVVSDVSVMPTFIAYLGTFKTLVLMLHLIGFALGVGGATIADILFMKFLKDFRISEKEDKVLKTMSQVIWLGLFIAIISGIGLYLPEMEALNESSKFLVKVVVVAVITINGALLNLLVSPKLVSISFKDEKEMQAGMNIHNTHRLRKLSFALGAISFTSWYTAFILGSLKSVPMTFLELLSLYIGIVVLAVIGSQIFEKILTRPRQN